MKNVSKQTEAFSMLNMEFCVSFAMEKISCFFFFFKYVIKRPYNTNHIFQFNSIQGQPSKDNVNQLQTRSPSEEICSGLALQSELQGRLLAQS